MPLTDTKVKNAKPPGPDDLTKDGAPLKRRRFFDGRGSYLEVGETRRMSENTIDAAVQAVRFFSLAWRLDCYGRWFSGEPAEHQIAIVGDHRTCREAR
ncbi:MAG TPA: hypothetical protein PJ986_11950 [Gammaproteobacteria bacterium]|nr:hypothetical protein [Gammaproteobacteria bacterium]